MTGLQIRYLNHLLHTPVEWGLFNKRERDFLVLLSTKLRYITITRREGMALEKIAMRIVGRDPKPDDDPGIPATWNHLDVTPEPETKHVGGPGGTRPDGTGDGNEDVPDRDTGRA